MNIRTLALLGVLAAAAPLPAQQPSALELQPGDHVALIGNALPDRFQHDGYFESLLYAQYPKHKLVVRNLAVAGDEVATRHRSENFGTPDDWLQRAKANVILAFFGFNESFQGYEGLDKFKTQLDKFVKDAKTKNYSGQGAPRVVLISPIAAERHRDPNFPDPAAINDRLKDYTEAMGQVAKANGIQFVDLLRPSQELYDAAAQKKQSLTVNGLHLTEEGDRQLASILFQRLLNNAPPAGDHQALRAAINEKNAEWHARYRTVDGYNVYGGRSQLSFENGKGGPKITNYKVMQEEMAQRDVMTANRDGRVWAVAQGGDLAVDDSNLPPITKVRSNKPGPNPDETHVFLSGEEAISKMTLHSGTKVNLFASEKEFPELVNPVQMAWDTKGRLWVAAWLNYPERAPGSKKGDSLLVFEDTDGDGKADKMTTFSDELNAPTGFQFYKDGVIVVQAPDLWFLRDTNGDGRADTKERILMGLDSADSHHTANAVCLDPGGAIYLSDGVFHRTQVETERGPVRNNDAAIFRFEPRSGKFETYIPYGFANPHGRVFDAWGNDLVTDATGNNTYFGAAFSGHLTYPAKHPGMRDVGNRPSRPGPGTGIMTSRHFPDEFMGNFLNCNVISFQGIYRVKVSEEGSGLKGETLENIISSSDPNFRPSAVSVGPDGALYICDWHNPIIGHMQHHIRDPNRDHGHGRVYRMTYEGRPLSKAPKIAGQPVEALLELLKSPENQVRESAKVELGARETKPVLAAVNRWTQRLDRKDPAYEHHMMEALWVHQWHNEVNPVLLRRMLQSPEPRARAAAARVLCYSRDRVLHSLAWFKELAEDAHPRVRLEAARAASFYDSPEAVNVALAILKNPTDYYLDYTLKETLRQLEPVWRKAIANGQEIAADNPAGVNYLVASLSTAELMKMPRTAGVLEAILSRVGVTDSDRNLALDALAREHKRNKVEELIALLHGRGKSDPALAGSLARLFSFQPPAELKAGRAEFESFTRAGSMAEVRQASWGAVAIADGDFDRAWAAAQGSLSSLNDLVSGIPSINDPDFRAKAYGRVMPLLRSVPAEIQSLAQGKKSAAGRYVRIELPRRGTLTLAEVQVFSGGRNIALQGKAKQSSVSNGGEASRAIDGRTDGSFGSGTQTHTQENEQSPWWEVDLGSEQSIDSVVVWNRTDAQLGKRLDGFTLKVLDGARSEVFKKTSVAAPEPSVAVALSGDPILALRQAAIRASVSMNHEPAEVFGALADLINAGELVPVAAQGLRALPRASWPKAKAGAVATALVAWANKAPVSARTSQDYVETTQFASDLAGLLPPDQAALARKELKELRVPVFVIRTVREQMRYDTPRIVVEPGKAVEIIFENADFMPHNLVIVRPGAREKIATVASLMKPDQVDGRGRTYVPETSDILSATKLIEAGQRAVLSITVPNEEGEMEYVCTFPGHAQLMWGQLIVTRDVDGYLQAHPEAKLPAPAANHIHE
ncbi:MAG: HEAT repeat domain-containing protein [Verrucomicrobia bacterium]|nr:HEAT repeat domain-containing protein [Verrucomicrobiota bacterium]